MDSKHFWTKSYGNPQNGQIHSGFTGGVFYVRARRGKSSRQECSAHLQPPAIRSLWRVAWASTFDSLAGTNRLSPHLGTNVCRFLSLSWLVCSCVGCPGVQHHGSAAMMTVHLRKRKSISILSQYNSCSCFPMLFLSSKFTRFFTVVDASKFVIMW